MFQNIFELPRTQKRLITLVVDSLFIFVAFWAAFILRLESLSVFSETSYWLVFSAILPLSIIALIRLGLYRAVLRFINLHALWAVLAGSFISTLSFIALAFYFDAFLPRSVPVIYACFCLLFIGGSRIIVRALFNKLSGLKKENIIIYGAGSAGRQLATALASGPEYNVVAFIDDDKLKHNSIVQGLKIYPFDAVQSLVEKRYVAKVLLALPSASRSRRKEVINRLEKIAVGVFTIPGMADIVDGSAKLEEFKEVDIEDLLGRDAVEPKSNLIKANIHDKVVMVTGAGGSIGSELCRQIIKQQPIKLVLFELSEFALYSVEKELRQLVVEYGVDVDILPVMGSVQRENRLEAVLTSFKVQTVYHAAAYKHVPLVELNVVEGVRNNIFGTLYCAEAAIKAGVEKFVLISTDKAVRPTNVMGATKRMAELVLQALAAKQDDKPENKRTNFSMVRFGNVLGSSGSVVPLFRKQIHAGGPVTLTHPDITRFFMTIPEAAQLVIQAGAMGKGGDVFVLDMGKSVKICDLAKKMIHLSGMSLKDDDNPNGDIVIECTGLRPGEKLYEELLIGDNVSGTTHERIMTANETKLDWEELQVYLRTLDHACHEFDHELIRKTLLDAPAGFNPTDGICDLVWGVKSEPLP